MNVVILSTLNVPVAFYLIQRLQLEWPIHRVIQSIRETGRHNKWAILKKMPHSEIAGYANQVLHQCSMNKMDKQIRYQLFGDAELPTIINCDRIRASDLNTEIGVKHIRALAPDILLLCVAPIIKSEIFSIPRIATVNVHFGIAPYFRGEHTIFWPLYFQDYENIGITLHHINKGIDAGRILARGYPQLERSDTEVTIGVKCAKIAAELTLDFLKAAENGKNIEGQQQECKGRLFLKKDRHIATDIHHYWKRNILRHFPAPRPERKERYYY